MQIHAYREPIRNPVARIAIAVSSVVVAGIFAAFVLFLTLPLVGVVVTLSLGFVGVVMVALGIGMGLVLIAAPFLGIILVPIGLIRDAARRSSDGDE
jgi:hypothetical protein